MARTLDGEETPPAPSSSDGTITTSNSIAEPSDFREELPAPLRTLISLPKWKWYDAEGFSREDMVDKRKIRNDLFEFIPADQIIENLSQ